jgi:sec-independent protein translocase protein TatB
MFEVGFSEILLILALALLVLGPEKLPGLAEKVGRWTGRARAMARQLRTQLEQEVNIEEMSRSRPMQAPRPPDPAPQPAAASAQASAPADAAPKDPPVNPPGQHGEQAPHAGPGLDLDKMVSGVETHSAHESAHAGDSHERR